MGNPTLEAAKTIEVEPLVRYLETGINQCHLKLRADCNVERAAFVFRRLAFEEILKEVNKGIN